MPHAAPEFAPKIPAALARCEICAVTATCTRPSDRAAATIRRRLGADPDLRWLCPDCDDQRRRGRALSALIRAACRPHPATVEAAVVEAALTGTPIDPDALTPALREGLIWAVAGQLYRLDECGQLADADDRPGPPRPALIVPAHPWTVARVWDRWGEVLAEYKILRVEWQGWGRPDVWDLAQMIDVRTSAVRAEGALRGWRPAGNGYVWPAEGAPLMAIELSKFGAAGGWITTQIHHFLDSRSRMYAPVPRPDWERHADAQDQAALWRALALIGVRLTPPSRRVGKSA